MLIVKTQLFVKPAFRLRTCVIHKAFTTILTVDSSLGAAHRNHTCFIRSDKWHMFPLAVMGISTMLAFHGEQNYKTL